MTNDTLESVLEELFPGKLSEFKKLTGGEPYRFDSWQTDTGGRPCLYYAFSSRDGRRTNTKRASIPEIAAALEHLRRTGHLRRSEFPDVCPVAQSAGPCGFAVVGRVLEALGVARYVRGAFCLSDATKAGSLLR
jgi:hypothetical protein